MKLLCQRADYVIDTSYISTAQLRGELLSVFGSNDGKCEMAVNITSFGFKYGLPMDADLVLDVRFLPNPYYLEELRPKTGNDKEIQEFVMKNDKADNTARVDRKHALDAPVLHNDAWHNVRLVHRQCYLHRQHYQDGYS